jgi:hypothetical protein
MVVNYRQHTPNQQLGATQPTQDEDPQATSNPLELLFMVSHREGTRTSHNPPIGAGHKHHPPLNDPHCSSRLGVSKHQECRCFVNQTSKLV